MFPGMGAVVGWLLKTAHLVCQNYKRAKVNRQKHEKEAAAMRQAQNDKKNITWEKVRLEIDAVLIALPQKIPRCYCISILGGTPSS